MIFATGRSKTNVIYPTDAKTITVSPISIPPIAKDGEVFSFLFMTGSLAWR